jgi:hypothetical protein
MTMVGALSALAGGAILTSLAYNSGQFASKFNNTATWDDDDWFSPSITGLLVLSAMVGSQSNMLGLITDKVNNDDDSQFALYHGTDIATANILLNRAPIEVGNAKCWAVSCGGFYLADNVLDADHFAVSTQGGFRDGGVVQYNFTKSAYMTIRGLATIKPLERAPRFEPAGNEIILSPSSFPIFNTLMLNGEINPSPAP